MAQPKKEVDAGGLMYQNLRKLINIVVSKFCFHKMTCIGRTERCWSLTVHQLAKNCCAWYLECRKVLCFRIYCRP